MTKGYPRYPRVVDLMTLDVSKSVQTSKHKRGGGVQGPLPPQTHKPTNQTTQLSLVVGANSHCCCQVSAHSALFDRNCPTGLLTQRHSPNTITTGTESSCSNHPKSKSQPISTSARMKSHSKTNNTQDPAANSCKAQTCYNMRVAVAL